MINFKIPGFKSELLSLTLTDNTAQNIYSGLKPLDSVFILERIDPSTNSLVNLDPSSLLSETISIINYKSDGSTAINGVTYPKYTYVTSFTLNNSGSQTNTTKVNLALLIKE